MNRSTALVRTIALVLVGGMTAGALGLYGLGSDRWIARGFSDRLQSADVWGGGLNKSGAIKLVVADEAYWLKDGRRDVMPAVDQAPQKLSFGPLDVLSVVPLPPILAFAAAGPQPMVLVTAEETTVQGTRVVRFIVEAGHAPGTTAIVGKGL